MRRHSFQMNVLRRFGLWFVFALVIALLAIVSPTFRSTGNLENILDQQAIIGIVACGMTVMMISGGFDLSVGAVGSASAVFAAVVSAHHGALLTVAAGLILGLLIGLANGLLIAKVRLNAFVVTFAMSNVVNGIMLVRVNANPQNGHTPLISRAARGNFGHIPVIFIIFLGCLLAVWVMLTRTKLGHYLYAVGGNAEASHLSGVPVQRVKILAFVIGGFFAAGAGVLLLGQTDVGEPTGNIEWPLQAIAICVVGGVALTGGVGRIEDVLVATLLLGVIANGLDQLNVSSYWQPAVTGFVILLAVVLDQYNRLHQAASRRSAGAAPRPNEPGTEGRALGEQVITQATPDGTSQHGQANH
jgi:ribose/xylose/arabinose/galactoside ABC-type transport system permease subunit